MKRRTLFILIGILFVAILLRFYNLTNLPPSLEWDEVATGYDAYSILKTGRDQYGNFFPLTIRSLDDYKPPLYTYLTVISIAIFGWNDFAVRFPAAFLGVFSILTTYVMVKELLKNEKLALFSGLLLAISPWHVNFSRLALETNSTIFFTTAATWFFLKGLKSGWWLLPSAVFFGLDLYLYHNARVFVPLIGSILLILYWKNLLKFKVQLFVSAFVLSLFLIRLIPIATSIEGQMRFQGTSIFSSTVPGEIHDAQKTYFNWRIKDQQYGIGLYGKFFHNFYVMYGLRLFENYLTHFNPVFWLFTDDYPRHHMPEMGLIYFMELPFILLGFYFLWKMQNKKAFILLFAWWIFAPIPASVTRDVPHALRVEIMLPIFQISCAAAILGIVEYLRSKRYVKNVFICIIAIGYFVHVSFFLHKFLFHYSQVTSPHWQYGRKEAAQYADSIKDKYKRIIVSTSLEQPHMFFLYYLKYDPEKYQAEGGTFSGGWAEERNTFDKYQFKKLPRNYQAVDGEKELLIGFPQEFSSNVNVIKKIEYLDGTDAIWLVET